MDEYEETIRFYSETLGMKIVRTWGEGTDSGIMLDTGDGTLMEIFADAEERLPMGAIRHFALDCSDVDAAVEAVRKAGYEVTMEPTDIVIESAVPYPARIAFVIGPVGEEIEFFCERD
jgi:glyoxylase I family protein